MPIPPRPRPRPASRGTDAPGWLRPVGAPIRGRRRPSDAGRRLLQRLTGEITDPADYRADYGSRADPWAELVVPVLQRMGASEVVQRTRPGWRRSIERVIKDGHKSKSDGRTKALTQAAISYARDATGRPGELGRGQRSADFLPRPQCAVRRKCAVAAGSSCPGPERSGLTRHTGSALDAGSRSSRARPTGFRALERKARVVRFARHLGAAAALLDGELHPSRHRARTSI